MSNTIVAVTVVAVGLTVVAVRALVARVTVVLQVTLLSTNGKFRKFSSLYWPRC